MNMKMKVVHFLWACIWALQSLNAQQGFVTCGGDILSVNGSLAFSIGQTAYSSFHTETGSIHQGIQQPFLSAIVNVGELHHNQMVNFYPNPAHRELYIQLSSDEISFLAMPYQVRLYDPQGILKKIQAMKTNITEIPIDDLPPGIFFIQVWQGDQFINSFSFIKTN